MASHVVYVGGVSGGSRKNIWGSEALCRTPGSYRPTPKRKAMVELGKRTPRSLAMRCVIFQGGYLLPVWWTRTAWCG